jgi:hypothetical protein
MSASVLDRLACAKNPTASLLVIAAVDELEEDEEDEGADEELDDEDLDEDAAEEDLEDDAAEDDFEDETAELGDDDDCDNEELDECDEALEFNEDDTAELLELTDVATLDELRLEEVTLDDVRLDEAADAALLEPSEDAAIELVADATNPPPPVAPPPPQAASDRDASAIPAPVFTSQLSVFTSSFTVCSGTAHSSTSFVCMVLPLGGR